MNRVLLILALLFFLFATLACPFFAMSAQAEMAVDAQPVAIKTLPNDAGKLYLTLFGADGDRQFGHIAYDLDHYPALRQFKGKTHYHAIATSAREYRQYAKSISALPCIRLQRADGQIMYEACGDSLPKSAPALLHALETPCCVVVFPRLKNLRDKRCQQEEKHEATEEEKTSDESDEPEHVAEAPAHPLAVIAIVFVVALVFFTVVGLIVWFVRYVTAK